MKSYLFIILILSFGQVNCQNLKLSVHKSEFYYSSTDSADYSNCGNIKTSEVLMFSKYRFALSDSSEISKLTMFLVDCPGDYGVDFFKNAAKYIITYEEGSETEFKKSLLEYEIFKAKGVKFYKAVKIEKTK
jgi:hypothetical protein